MLAQSKFRDAPVLLGRLLKQAFLTGAVAPSSKQLAHAMVLAAGHARHVVELGAGTGPVTHELRRLMPAASLVAVELQPELARRLGHRFPGLDVREAPAHEVLAGLTYPGEVAVVSSLPFRSLPKEMREGTALAIERFLERHPGSSLVQFTYQPRAPFTASPGFQWEKMSTVWRNTPPAGLWRLQVRSGKMQA